MKTPCFAIFLAALTLHAADHWVATWGYQAMAAAIDLSLFRSKN